MRIFKFSVDCNGNIGPVGVHHKMAHKGDRVVVDSLLGEPGYRGKIWVTLHDKNSCAELFGVRGMRYMALAHPYTINHDAAFGDYSIVAKDPDIADGTKGDLNVGSGPGDGDDGPDHK